MTYYEMILNEDRIGTATKKVLGGSDMAKTGAGMSVLGVGGMIGTGAKWRTFKKNAKTIYAGYKAEGGKLPYDEWYKKMTKKYRVTMAASGIGTAAGIGLTAGGVARAKGGVKSYTQDIKPRMVKNAVNVANSINTNDIKTAYNQGYNTEKDSLLNEECLLAYFNENSIQDAIDTGKRVIGDGKRHVTKNVAINAGSHGVSAAGALTMGITGLKWSTFKKNANQMYKGYKAEGGKLPYDEWYKKMTKKYKIAMGIGGGLAVGGVATRKINSAVNRSKYEKIGNKVDIISDVAGVAGQKINSASKNVASTVGKKKARFDFKHGEFDQI